MIYGNVSDFSTCTVISGDHMSVHDNSTADTGTKRYHDDIFTSFSTALPHFAKTCNVRIISDFYFQTCLCTEFLRNIDHSPAEIDTPVNNAITPHRTRNTDSHTLYITLTDAFLRQFVINRLCNIRQYCLSVIAGICLDFPFVKKLSACLKKSHFYGGSSHVYAKSIFLQFLIPP